MDKLKEMITWSIKGLGGVKSTVVLIVKEEPAI